MRFSVATPGDRWLIDTVHLAWRTRILVRIESDLRLRLWQAAEDAAVQAAGREPRVSRGWCAARLTARSAETRGVEQYRTKESKRNTRCGSAHPSAVDWQLRLAEPAAGSEPDHASSKGRSNMPLYMYQAAYTPESWAAQLKNPQNRIETVGRQACEAVGGKLVGGWYCFGDYDLVIIADVPSNEAMSAIALAIAAGGAIKSSKTTVLMSGSEIVGALKKATAVAKGYKPAR